MTESQLKFLFQQKYNPQNWKEILSGIFIKIEYFSSPHILAERNEEIKFVRQIGNISIADGNIGIFEVEIANKIKISRSRVKLRELTAKYIDQDKIHGAFVLYYAANQSDYRFTFIAKKTNLSEEGEILKFQTPPKRYTYVLGQNESCTTAAKRFLELSLKESISFENVIQAFSVEKLTKEFFKKYKEHYELFCDNLAGSTYRKSVFNIPLHKDKKENSKAEKPIRDFVKLLLGRIVFLHFLQKKDWLGCPSGLNDWKDGDPLFLHNLFLNFKDKDHYLSKCLNKLFFDTLNTKRVNDKFEITQTRVPYLNGGLFDNIHPEYNVIEFPSNLFEDLFDFFSQYNFTIDENSPDEHEVGIDPEMLGHIFENLLEDNKDKGAFYTPKEIVHYMCHESLIQYLKTNISAFSERREYKEDSEDLHTIEAFIHSHELSQFIRDNAKKIDSLLDNVKICDPAIGSGAFPMGLLKEIFQAKLLIYPYLKTNHTFNPGIVKRNIIQNSIYGVDIDSGAVDIARLRFWLSLIVDEEEPTPLPNLDYKIMQGNSLLESFEGIDLSHAFSDEFKVTLVDPQINIFSGNVEDPQYQVNFTPQQKMLIKDLAEKYFKETDKAEKVNLHKNIEDHVLNHIELSLEFHKNKKTILLAQTRQELKERIKPINKLSARKQYLTKNKLLLRIEQLRKELKEIDSKYSKLKALEETPERPYFLWHFYFKDVFDNGGFDIVIGNPPYISIQKLDDNNKTLLENEGFKTFEKTGDIYSLFYEIGNKLLKGKGILTYITSRQWIHSSYGKKTRKYLIEDTNPIKLVDFGKVKIFEAATVFVNILIFQKNIYNQELKGCEVKSDFNIDTDRILEYFANHSVQLNDLSENTWKIGNDLEMLINQKIEKIGKPLAKFDVEFYAGIKTAFNPAFHIDGYIKKKLTTQDLKNKEIIKPLLRGKDIKRYHYSYQNLYLINTHNGVKELDISRIDVVQDYPVIYDYLKQFKNDLIIRQDQGVHWTNLRNCAFLEEFKKEKIVWLEISDKANYAFDDKGMYLTNSAYFLTGKNLKYLLAILNSKLSDYYFFQITAKIAGGRKRYTKQYVGQVRIPEIPEAQQKPFVNLVDIILDAKQQVKDTTALENEIDLMVYKLYNLTYEEVKIIDTKIDEIISKEDYDNFNLQ
ncbi:MAG: Eco57I restriction-modification methylase domain-containing protein [Ignavibacteriaceae bacterium]